jgi:hypothetical protein
MVAQVHISASYHVKVSEKCRLFKRAYAATISVFACALKCFLRRSHQGPQSQLQMIKLSSKMRIIASVAAIAVLASPIWAMQFPDCVNGPALLTKNLVCNTTASPADRAKAIVAAMNITEKIANMVEYINRPSTFCIIPTDLI